MGKLEKKVHCAITDEFITLLKEHEEEVLEIFDSLIARQKFMSMRYKDEESYDKLLSLKRIRNKIAYIFKL